jgi:hypothetical protein
MCSLSFFCKHAPRNKPGIGTLLRAEQNPPIREVIATGVVPKLVEFLGYDNMSQLQVRVIPLCLVIVPRRLHQHGSAVPPIVPIRTFFRYTVAICSVVIAG